jgi:hypothetical protein
VGGGVGHADGEATLACASASDTVGSLRGGGCGVGEGPETGGLIRITIPPIRSHSTTAASTRTASTRTVRSSAGGSTTRAPRARSYASSESKSAIVHLLPQDRQRMPPASWPKARRSPVRASVTCWESVVAMGASVPQPCLHRELCSSLLHHRMPRGSDPGPGGVRLGQQSRGGPAASETHGSHDLLWRRRESRDRRLCRPAGRGRYRAAPSRVRDWQSLRGSPC